MPVDQLLRATNADNSLRVLAAITTDLVGEACRRHGVRGVEAVALGRALTAGCLLTTLTKHTEERMRLDLRTDGPLGGLLVDARGDGTVRGCLRRELGDHPLRALVETRSGRLPLTPFLGRRGSVTVTRDLGLEQRYQGTVELRAGEVDVDLEHYLNISEQLPSVLRCEVLLDAQCGVLRAAGVLCQTFPGADREALEEIRRIVDDEGLSALLMQPRSPQELVGFVLGGAPHTDMSTSPIAFRCGCGPAVAREVVSTLGPDDIDALAGEQELTEVRCSYCGERYELTSADLRELAAELRSQRS